MSLRWRSAWVLSGASIALLPAVALAHGDSSRPTALSFFIDWEFDPLTVVPLLLIAAGYAWLYRRATRTGKPPPIRRPLFFAAGMVTLVIALMSPIATFDDELFFIHMWQHVLLTMVAPPLLLLGMPVTLILRACSPRWRNDVVLPLLHSRVASVILFPVVTWLFFVVTAWVTHFSPIYNASLSNDWIHIFEHAWYLFAGLLFWWHVVEADPGRWRLSHPARLLYMFAMMAQTTFLGLAFYSSNVVFYSGYEVDRGWGPSPLADQQAAGASIWIGGLAVSMITVFILVADWMEAEERSERRREEAAHTPRLH